MTTPVGVVTGIARDVVVNGATGFVGRALVETLMARGHRVRVLVRVSSLHRVAPGVEACVGDPLDPAFLRHQLRSGDTLVHLIGTAHPNPSKAEEFLRVDLASVQVAIAAASFGGIAHFVYVSVAQPAPVMRAYVAARAQAERLIAEAGLAATVLRPWYVLGPRRRWPVILMPLYALAALVPSWRAQAKRMGFVTRQQMVAAIVAAIELPPAAKALRILDVAAIRRAATGAAASPKHPASDVAHPG